MAKQSYKIPESLDKSFADTQISLQSKDGVGAKPMPIGYILAWVLSILVLLMMVTKTFIASASLSLIILFVILWMALTFVLLKRDKLGIPQASMVVSMLNYLPKGMRRIHTRNMSRANDFSAMVGIESINPETGFIQFWDGSCGFMYRVVGTASVLLFEEDRVAILDRCDAFYRKMRTDTEMIFITVKEPQKVYRQLSAIYNRYNNLTVDDPELRAMADTEFKCLKDEVGAAYRSIHQYLILKSNNAEELTVAKNMLQTECENSSLVFKQCTALFGDDIYDVLRTIYRGKESV